MIKYHKIQTVFKRDLATNYKTLLSGQYSCPEFKYLENNQWLFTEKVDGTNIRVLFDGRAIRVKGKTDKAQMYPGMYEYLDKLFMVPSKFDLFKNIFKASTPKKGKDLAVCLYGEGYGAGIQKGGGFYRKDKGFVLFDVWVNGWWLQRQNVVTIANELDIDVVPIVMSGTLLDMVKLVKTGFNSQWGKFKAEGVVARPVVELRDRSGQRIITKLKYKDF